MNTKNTVILGMALAIIIGVNACVKQPAKNTDQGIEKFTPIGREITRQELFFNCIDGLKNRFPTIEAEKATSACFLQD